MINLYYIRGINRYDTPYFANKEAQATYFNSSVKKASVEAWYPPHYSNTIRLTSEDINFNSQINYLGLEFNGKEYYYFIDDISYIDEDTVEVSISMDTIQTYMFNIEWINSTVNKRLINRWNGDKINRKYIRNNLGNSLYDVFIYYEAPYRYPHIVISSAENLGVDNYKFPTSFYYDDKLINDSTYTSLIIDTFKDNTKYRLVYNEKQLGTDYTIDDCMKWNDENKIEKAYMFMYYQLGDVNEQIENGVTKLILSNELDATNFVPVLQSGIPRQPFCQIGKVKITPDSYTITTPFQKNKSKEKPFAMIYIPQLLDENYVQIKFGERLGYTTYPTSLMLDTTLKGTALNDYKTGNRIFKLEQNTTEKDKYLTTIVNSTEENITLINDAYKNYLAMNKGQLVSGIAKAAIGAVIFPNFAPMPPVIEYTKVRRKLTKNYLRKKAQYDIDIDRFKTTEAQRYAQNKYDVTSDLVGVGSGFLNSAFQPDTTKQGNSVTSDIYANALKRFYSIEMCTNIDDVAKAYEGYGYEVHEDYTNENLFNVLNTRYYFNVIQCSQVNISLNGVINDDSTIAEIESRLQDGIRMWNGEIGKYLFVYDNVEKEYIES